MNVEREECLYIYGRGSGGCGGGGLEWMNWIEYHQVWIFKFGFFKNWIWIKFLDFLFVHFDLSLFFFLSNIHFSLFGECLSLKGRMKKDIKQIEKFYKQKQKNIVSKW